MLAANIYDLVIYFSFEPMQESCVATYNQRQIPPQYIAMGRLTPPVIASEPFEGRTTRARLDQTEVRPPAHAAVCGGSRPYTEGACATLSQEHV